MQVPFGKLRVSAAGSDTPHGTSTSTTPPEAGGFAPDDNHKKLRESHAFNRRNKCARRGPERSGDRIRLPGQAAKKFRTSLLAFCL